MTIQAIVELVRQNAAGFGIAAAVAGVILVHLTQWSFYTWYFIVLAGAGLTSVLTHSPLYFYAFVLGVTTAFAEIIGKFNDEPIKSLRTPHAVVYHVANGVIAAFALHVLLLNLSAPPTAGLDQLKLVTTAGLGSMLIMRSKLFNIKVGDEDVSLGPDQIVKVFFSFMEEAIDRVRAQSRIAFVKTEMDNLDYERISAYTRTMLNARQLLGDEETKKLNDGINALETDADTKQLKSYKLGFLLLNAMGEDFVSRLFEERRVEWLIKAPSVAEQKQEGIMQRLPIIGSQRQTIAYLAYGSSMATRRFRERLNWLDPQGAEALDETAPTRAELPGYRLEFSKPDEAGVLGLGFANLTPDAAGTVEGVVYQLTPQAVDFLERAEPGYARQTVKVKIGGKDHDAVALIARSPRENLKPSRDYLNVLIAGAREHGLSDAYVASLAAAETLDAFIAAPRPSPGALRQIES